MLNEDSAKQHVTTTIDQIYNTLQSGFDVSTGDRLRFEGQVELLLQFNFINEKWLRELINQRYQYYFQLPIDEIHWQWAKQDKRFYLPFKMQEAPVYKT